MEQNLVMAITTVLKQTPQWIRTDLAAKDAGLRERAEEALAAMLVAAMTNADKAAGS